MMNLDLFQLRSHLLAFVTNRVLLCAAVAWLMAQIIKIFTSPRFRKGFSVGRLITGSGGMPSSHAAVVCATAFSCGILYGYDSAVFAISAILAVVVMRDAAGIRREAGKQAEAINQMSRELGKRRRSAAQITLSEMIGHTPIQVIVGGLLGVAMAFFCQFWLFDKFLPAI